MFNMVNDYAADVVDVEAAPEPKRSRNRGNEAMIKHRASAEADLEGNIHELVRRDSNAVRQTDGESEAATRNLADLLRRVSANSTGEIDALISGEF